jgi:hypothetical protein
MEDGSKVSTKDKWIGVSDDMSQCIISDFSIEEQNEILRAIKHNIKKSRECLIESDTKSLENLKVRTEELCAI